MDFEILINDSFLNINNSSGLSPVHNKNVLSLINSFEEGDWEYEKFQRFIWDNIAETSLTFDERAKLVNQSMTSLQASARNLRLTDKDKIGQGSEIAEIIMYGIMKHHYNALPVVPKIYFKQSTQHNAHGADSVHIVVKNDDFSLWIGEAKFYTSLESAEISKIVSSVKTNLSKPKLKKENAIITGLSELDKFVLNPSLLTKIKRSLDVNSSLDILRPLIHVPILIVHECSITESASMLSQQYRDDLINFHTDRATAYFKKQISVLAKEHMYQDMTFHILLIPVPKKQPIVDSFINFTKALKP